MTKVMLSCRGCGSTYPTDEELLGLPQKEGGKGTSPYRYNQIHSDIYKYDPWNPPKAEASKPSTISEEWHFFRRRGKMCKNSIRFNRVSGSGFWKATGIDKPIYFHRRFSP